MKVTILYYGAFRAHGKQAELLFSSPVTIGDIKTALAEHMGQQHKPLIDDSVLAGEKDILPDDFVIESDCILYILPPVCGG